jgi:hypothetical protein
MSLGIPLLMCTLAFGPATPPGERTPSREKTRIADTIDYHVRATDPLLRAWITNGGAQSATLKSLIDELVTSDIIVHVVMVDRISGANGHLYFVTTTPTARYLRIEVTRVGGRADMIALLAHELQHAVEVAHSPSVRDANSLATFYLRVGENLRDPRHYDSIAARVTEDIVRREVLGHRSVPDDELQLMAQLRQQSRSVR